MTLRKWSLVAVVCALMSTVGLAQAPKPLTAQDMAEIEQLYSRYSQGADFFDNELWLSVFAADAVFATSPKNSISGMKALQEYRATRTPRPGAKNRHYNSGLVITGTPEGAKGRAYYMFYDVSGKQAVPVTSGYYEDTFVKTADGWKIKTRTVFSDASPRPAAEAGPAEAPAR